MGEPRLRHRYPGLEAMRVADRVDGEVRRIQDKIRRLYGSERERLTCQLGAAAEACDDLVSLRLALNELDPEKELRRLESAIVRAFDAGELERHTLLQKRRRAAKPPGATQWEGRGA